MFATIRNEARIRCVIEADGPLIIRAAAPSNIDPTRPDMEFVRDGAGQLILPGSSLKGVIRSRAERILRRERPNDGACNPFCGACGQGQNLRPRGEERYAQLCYACRLFGSVALRGRAAFADARPVDPAAIVLGQRTHVAVNRVSGGPASGSLFSPEVVERGSFRAEIVLTNFALWQFLILLNVLQEMDEGLVRLGGATTRGYGRVRVRDQGVQVMWRDYRQEAPTVLCGYLDQDRSPAGLGTPFHRGPYGWETSWTGLKTSLDQLGDLSLTQALEKDVARKEADGARRQR